MPRLSLGSLFGVLLLLGGFGCATDEDAPADMGSTRSDGAADAGPSDRGVVDTGAEADLGTSPLDAGLDASMPDEGSADSGLADSGVDAGLDAGTDGGTGDGSICSNVSPGPFEPTLATDAFSGSEDITFDGLGGLIGKNGNQLIRVFPNGTTEMVATVSGQSYGVRFVLGGALIVAQPGAGELLRVDGMIVAGFVDNLSGPNGVYGDTHGYVFVTEFSGDRVLRIDLESHEILPLVDGSPAAQPNGVVLDEQRSMVFFSNYSQGSVFRVDPIGATEAEPVGSVSGAALDGLVLDACGHLYAVDNANDRVYRFNLDANAGLIGTPELIAELPSNVANAQFGSGPGWNATSLYIAGNPGDVYEVPVGVPGAPVPGR